MSIGRRLEINAEGGLPETRLPDRSIRPQKLHGRSAQATMEAAEERSFSSSASSASPLSR